MIATVEQKSLVRIPKDLANQLRILAIKQDRRLLDVLREALTQYLDSKGKEE